MIIAELDFTMFQLKTVRPESGSRSSAHDADGPGGLVSYLLLQMLSCGGKCEEGGGRIVSLFVWSGFEVIGLKKFTLTIIGKSTATLDSLDSKAE